MDENNHEVNRGEGEGSDMKGGVGSQQYGKQMKGKLYQRVGEMKLITVVVTRMEKSTTYKKKRKKKRRENIATQILLRTTKYTTVKIKKK